MTHSAHPIVVIGAGIAGLTAALRLVPNPVILVANAPIGQGVASGWSQGGIAAALSEHDSPVSHQQDTLTAAAGIADENAVKIITTEAKIAIEYLREVGVTFDRTENNDYALSKEAAHSHARIVRVAGDLTGPGIMAALQRLVLTTPEITVKSGWQLVELHVQNNRVHGVWLAHSDTQKLEYIPTNAVIMATGGIGYLYRNTSNPSTACGEGIAIAAKAGAVLADMEFVQFHPTTLAVGRDPSPLATEALRGEGAHLINELGERFMTGIHPDAELAPRDVVARAIFNQYQSGHKAFLDCRSAIGADFAKKFPKVFSLCQEAGIDPVASPIPVEPAAHYHMGGIAVNTAGQSSVMGLWACGEVACTGAHGANRLASNSLLEAVVYTKRATHDVKKYRAENPLPIPSATPAAPEFTEHTAEHKIIELRLRDLMRDYVGVIRDGKGLAFAIKQLSEFYRESLSSRVQHMVDVALLVALFAYWREESRGSHFRKDFPIAKTAWQKRQFFTQTQCLDWLKQKPSQQIPKA